MRSFNLPAPITSFVGRDVELSRLQTALREPGHRLITLTGPVGCGKSRLALEAARAASNSVADGGAWVDLSGVSGASEAVDAILGAVEGLTGAQIESPDALARAVSAARILLVLDDCDGVVAGIRSLVRRVLQTCPNVRVLATSREAFHLRGETLWPVTLLPCPPTASIWAPEHGAPHGARTPSDWLAYDSIRLFAERAAAVSPGFELTEQNAATIARICQRLEGNPLAIERAAATTRVLTPTEMVAWLADTVRVLDHPRDAAAVRPRGLWASLLRDYDALAESEQRLFRQLSVFNGGATFDAIRAVVGADSPPIDMMRRLARLVDKSLLVAEQGNRQTRYRLLAAAQEFGRERLELAGESARFTQAHCGYYLALAESANALIRAGSSAQGVAQLEYEEANLEAALQTSLEGDPASALRLAGALARYWEVRGYVAAGRRWLEDVLAQAPPEPSPARALALDGAAVLAHNQSDYQRARELHEAARDMWRDLGDSRGMAFSLYNLAMLAKGSGDYAEATRLFEQSLSIFQTVNDRAGYAYALLNYGILKHVQGEYRASTTLFEESLIEMRRLGDSAGLAAALSNRGLAARNQGQYVEAAAFHAEALAIRHSLGDTLGVALSLTNLGFLAYDQAGLRDASEYLQQALGHFQDVGNQWGVALSRLGLAQVAAQQDAFGQAIQLCGEALALYKDVDYQWGIAMGLYIQAHIFLRMGNAVGALEAGQRSLALRWEIRDRHGIAECLEVIAAAAAVDHFYGATAWLDGAAVALRRLINAPRSPMEVGQLERALTPAREADAARYAVRHEAGGRRSLEDIVDYALRPSLKELDEMPGGAPVAPPETSQMRWLTPGDDAGFALRIHALGVPQAYRQGRLLAPSDWTYAKPRELMYFLLSYPNRSKEQIGVALWPDASPAQLRSAIHSALHRLRRAVGQHDCVLVEDELYTFNRSISYWYDVEVFEAHLEAATRLRREAPAQAIYHLETAVSLYKGDFLEGTVGTTEWVFLRREALRQRLIETLLTLGQILFAQRRYDQAAEVYRRAVSVDSYLEEAHRELMRCYVRQGERSQAIRHYQHLVDILNQELHVPPAPETASLYERLIGGYGI
ncbi:MAG: BTAD domain-containing putative transcriptional regulator [Anaerolineae bacterium]